MKAPLVVRFEDEDFIVISKPCGLLVDSGRESEDVISQLSAQIGRPVFAFHRLDQETSGLLLLGKRKLFSAPMTQAFETKQIRKSYLAVVSGLWPKDLTRIAERVGDREALTTFRTLFVTESRSVIEALPKTGRKHQIRLHCAHAQHPVLGDVLYGSPKTSNEAQYPGHALHAYRLDFTHPRTKQRISLKDRPDPWTETWLHGLELAQMWERLSR